MGQRRPKRNFIPKIIESDDDDDDDDISCCHNGKATLQTPVKNSNAIIEGDSLLATNYTSHMSSQ